MRNISLGVFFLFLLGCGWFSFVHAQTGDLDVSGRILLQVESEGEGWYVNPEDKKRYYLGRPDDAFSIMRTLGQGISNRNLRKIPVAVSGVSGNDSDGDGLPDVLETTLGTDPNKKDTDEDGFIDKEELESNYNPRGEGKLPIDRDFVNNNQGRIFLQVENNGEAWYINPKNHKRYFLGKPRDAFNIMRNLGLGIKNEHLQEIPVGEKEVDTTEGETGEQVTSSFQDKYDLRQIEKDIHKLINQKRTERGLKGLEWNSEVARVARMHSRDLAEENESFTSEDNACDLPMIHHEGLEFGLYNNNRLHDQDIYYFSQSGENIALVSTNFSTYSFDQNKEDPFKECKETRRDLNEQLKSDLHEVTSTQEKIRIIEEEMDNRKEIFNNLNSIHVEKKDAKSAEEVSRDVVSGWMNSPPHRENILQPDFNEAGIGVAHVNGFVIATQSFIKKVDCGYKQGPCCEKEGYYPYCYKPWECQQNTCVATSTGDE